VKPEVERFIGKFLSELRQNNVAVFVGAGLSRSAGYVDWAGLLSPLAQEINLDSAREADLVALAQYYVNAKGAQRNEINQHLINNFTDLAKPTNAHHILARLPVTVYWTTNYDHLLEDAIASAGRRLDVKRSKENLSTTLRDRDAILYKMHGDIDRPDLAILTKDDYENYQITHTPFVTALSGDLVERTFLFLGFSFTDPNIDYILSRIRLQLKGNQRTHYWLTKRYLRHSYDSDEEFGYARAKQDHVIADLKRFNVEAVLVDEYPEIVDVLRTIENRHRRRTVFLSGSVADYGAHDKAKVEEFVSQLGANLISDDFRIASGMGVGVGTTMVTGAVQQIYSSSTRSIQNALMLRPFPIGIEDKAVRAETFQRYREELLDQAGISVFIMGNKYDGGVIADSPGVWDEFKLAKSKGLYIIPVGGLGGMSAKIAKEVLSNFAEYYPDDDGSIKTAIEKLNRPMGDVADYLVPLRVIINRLAKD